MLSGHLGDAAAPPTADPAPTPILGKSDNRIQDDAAVATAARVATPIPLLRGAVAWSTGGARTGEGPSFIISLADQPQLGASYTSWFKLHVKH